MSSHNHKHSRTGAIATEGPRNIAGLGMDVPELRQARGLWQINRFDEAIELFEKAVRKYPQNLVALIDASRALGTRFEISKAEVLLDRMSKLGAHNPQLLHLAGQSYRIIFRPDKAMDCFERVQKLTRNIPDSQLELAVLYERRHRVAEAYEMIESCLRAAPNYHEASLFKARLLRRMNEAAAADDLFRKLAGDERVHPLIRAQAWTEIAQKLDKDGDYDGAMAAMQNGKSLLRAGEAPLLKESEGLQAILRTLTERITHDDFNRWAAQLRGLPQKKMAVLASFPRSGTTLLEQVLDSHSGLISSDEREAFGRDIFPAMWRSPTSRLPTLEALNEIPVEHLARLRDRYLSYMSAALNEPIGDRYHLDKNPTLTLLLPGMMRLFPETRLIIALRDPRDIVVSCFMQYLPLNSNSVCFLTMERTAKRYAHDMEAWLRLREQLPAQWLEVRYEDCVMDLEKRARKALEFLGLPWEENVMQYRDRLAKKAVASPTYEAVSRPLYTSAIGRWKHYRKHLEPALEVLEPLIKTFGYEPS